MLEVFTGSAGGSCFLLENQEVTVSNGDGAIQAQETLTAHVVDLALVASVIKSEELAEDVGDGERLERGWSIVCVSRGELTGRGGVGTEGRKK